MASISKRGNSYRAMVYYQDANGMDKRSTKTFKLKKDAQAWALDLEHKIANGADLVSSKMTYPEYYKLWIETYKLNSIRPASYKKYISWLGVLEKLFQNVPMDKLSTPLIQQKLDEFGQTHSPEYMKNFVLSIKSSLKDAMIDGIITRDIFTRLSARGNEDRKSRTKNYLDATEFETLQAYLYDNLDTPFNMMILMALETGARAGEIQALTVSDIDLSNHTISIDKSYSYNVKAVTKPKNKSSVRVITISNTFVKCLSQYISSLETENIFPEFYSAETRLNRLSNITKAAKVTPIRFHGLRHSHVSYLLHNGVDISYISKRVGHANTSVTLNTYAHLLKEKEQTQDELALAILQNF